MEEYRYETADGQKFKTFKEAKEYLQKTYPEAWETNQKEV